MILQALVGFYEQLAKEHPGKIARVGWCSRQVAFMLVLSSKGELVNVIPSDEKRGWTMMVPEQVKRTVGVAANLLCDNATYLLGIDAKGKPERARQCFEAARERHLAFLQEVDSPTAMSIRRFFETWDPEGALSHVAVADAGEALLAGGNLVFRVDGKNALDDPAIRSAWERACERPSEDAAVMTCLVSGKQAPIARLHPAIKGVAGAQAMGASLVGFNARAFESYGHDEEQGLNAPVSEYATFAYSTALNYLLSDRKHHMRVGDTTVVYWADKHDQACVDIMSDFLNPQTGVGDDESCKGDPDHVIDALMKRIARGLPVGEVDPDANFYVLGLAPNAARLSVRFFQRDTFGAMLDNLYQHYERLDIVHAPYEKKYLVPYRLLAETENPNAKQPAATSLLGGALLRSILGNQRYPEALFEQTILRVRSTRDVSRGMAAIIKAYLIKNKGQNHDEEVVTVALNTERKDEPYLLGRLFSRLEDLQYAANPDINATIKDKYFDAASTTPALVFPVLIRLSEQHARKLKREKPGYASAFWREIREFSNEFQAYPKTLSYEDQGAFLLGYYHQSQQSFIDRKNAKEQSKMNSDKLFNDQEA